MNNKLLKPILFASTLILLTACDDDDDDATPTADRLINSSSIASVESNADIEGVWLVSNTYSGTDNEKGYPLDPDAVTADAGYDETEDYTGQSVSIVTIEEGSSTSELMLKDCYGDTETYQFNSETRKATRNESDGNYSNSVEIDFSEDLATASGSFSDKYNYADNYDGRSEVGVESSSGSLSAKKISNTIEGFTIPASIALKNVVTYGGEELSLSDTIKVSCFSVSSTKVTEKGVDKDDDSSWSGTGTENGVFFVGVDENFNSVWVYHETDNVTGSATIAGKAINYSCKESEVMVNGTWIESEICVDTADGSNLDDDMDNSVITTDLSVTNTKASASVSAKGDTSEGDMSEISLEFSIDL